MTSPPATPHPHRRWTWAHVQQRLRRNVLLGPLIVLALVIVACRLHYEGDGLILQHLPLVEAVPFLRRFKRLPVNTAASVATASTTTSTNSELDTRESKPAIDTRESKRAIDTRGGASRRPPASALQIATAAFEEATATAASVIEEAASVIEDATPTALLKRSPVKAPTHSAVEAPTASPAAVAKPNTKKRKTSSTDYNFPLLADNAKFVKDATSPIPFRYYEAHQHNNEVARKAVLATLKWRQDQQIDTILSRPHFNYDIAKRIIPHYWIGRSSTTGHVVFVQRPGLADLPLAKHNGLTLQDMLDEYAYSFEYCWNMLHDNTSISPAEDNDLMIGIMDLQGASLGVLRDRALISFAKEFISMLDQHYPTRAKKTYMVNAPGWFGALYKLISPIMRETTKEKIVLFSAGKQQDAALEEALGKNMAQTVKEALRVPTKQEKKTKAKDDLSLTSDILLETDMEQQIREFVMTRLNQEGMDMKKMQAIP